MNTWQMILVPGLLLMCLKEHLLKRLDSNKACAHCWHEDKVAMTVLLASVEASSSSTCLWCGRKSEKCRHHHHGRNHHPASNIIQHQTSLLSQINYNSNINSSPTSSITLILNHFPWSLKKPIEPERNCFVPRQVALVVARILANPCW